MTEEDLPRGESGALLAGEVERAGERHLSLGRTSTGLVRARDESRRAEESGDELHTAHFKPGLELRG